VKLRKYGLLLTVLLVCLLLLTIQTRGGGPGRAADAVAFVVTPFQSVLTHVHRRALGILRALAEAKGEIVSKDELMAQAWPGRVVEEGNLHVHVSALRK